MDLKLYFYNHRWTKGKLISWWDSFTFSKVVPSRQCEWHFRNWDIFIEMLSILLPLHRQANNPRILPTFKKVKIKVLSAFSRKPRPWPPLWAVGILSALCHCHHLSLFVIICHYLSLSVIICHHLSLFVIICHYL